MSHENGFKKVCYYKEETQNTYNLHLLENNSFSFYVSTALMCNISIKKKTVRSAWEF
jgi:hypothetical protein